MTLTNDELRILLMEEQMRRDREKSLAIHEAAFPKESKKVEESTSIFDNTLRPLPTNLYLDCKEYERGERWHKLGPEYVLAPNYLYLSAITYHFIFYALPLWLFIMLYW